MPPQPDSRYAALRLLVALVLMTVGASGMYVVAVVLPAVQAEFGVARADASMPYTWMMIGFGIGGILMGKLADRHGVTVPILISAAGLGLGYAAAGVAGNIWLFSAAHGLLIGLLGSSATFAPLIADTALWFVRRRGIAVAVCASGNYLAGTVWPIVLRNLLETGDWRHAYIAIGSICAATMLPLALILIKRAPSEAEQERVAVAAGRPPRRVEGEVPKGPVQGILVLAGIACCVAMSMPQVHIVAYCGDLGYGAARGAEMLSLMLGFGIVSRLVSGAICDRIGGLRTLLLGSALQGVALLLFLPFDGLASLYVISALFGLFQGGIVPSYAIIVREHFPPREAGTRTGTVLMFTLLGMALGGWMSGKVFDLTGSYDAAFVNGIAWNLLNLAIATALLYRARRRAYA